MASSIAAAKAHIAKIRHDKGFSEDNTTSHNVSDLESALTTLSEQLYQSSTRFLLELLQNCDDNEYDPNVEPTVHFTYSNGSLRVDCNEVGFSARNVEALCRVGQSTKKNTGNARTYVGEKGIGFKSVFKAADVVWISSREYSFKFVKSQPLGMIAPIWDDFPAATKPGFTSFYLQLSRNYNRRGLIDELRSLDSRLLIFLRRIRNVKVSISESCHLPWEKTFSRSKIGKALVRLVEDNKACDYIITRHQVSNMPAEPKREGISSSEIVLGFPITKENMPKRESQRVYAFLPIRDYGFEFLIQADFLLIASREDIDESSEWNRALRKALSNAFVDTINNFNTGPFRYLWPRYLPTREPLQSFLKPFHTDMMEKLRSLPTIFSWSGELKHPRILKYVPKKFMFNGEPLMLSAHTSQCNLSANYSSSDFEYLEILGVNKMSEFDFYDELVLMLGKSMGEFKAKSKAWHSHLASVLMSLTVLSTVLPTITLVPLNDGSWVAAKGRKILFPAQTSEFDLPGGLELSVVHSDAANDPERRRLCVLLGVGNLEQEPVVLSIVELHKNTPASSVSRSAFVSQIRFLYSAKYTNPKFQRFWFIAEGGQKFQGSNLYQDSSKPHSASKFFGPYRNNFHFIHKDYVSVENQDKDSWARWLEQKMDVATMPRLVHSTEDGGFKMSEDFEFIIKTASSKDVLLLLRDNWEEYSKFLSLEERNKCSKEDKIFQYDSTQFAVSADRVKLRLGAMLVTCTSGERIRLDKTFLPKRELLVGSTKGMSFVDVPDADNGHWKVLETLGVSIKADVSFYLRCLEALAEAKSDDSARVEKLLTSIQLCCDDVAEAKTTKDFFAGKKLVFVPNHDYHRYGWNSLLECRWNGPRNLKTWSCLKDIYPGNKNLFCVVLDLQDVTVQALVYETKFFSTGDSLRYITKILHTMEKLLEQQDSKSIKIDFCKLPVSKNWQQDTGLATDFEKTSDSSEWFIADTAPFRTIFAGIVPLLDIQVDDLAAMKQVLGKLGLQSRFLSKNATSVPRTKGVVRLNQELTDAFRKKVNFIIRLIPTSKQFRERRQKLIVELQNLQVYNADEVVQEWCVKYKGKQVKGPPGNGRVALVAQKDVLKIYIAAKSEFGEEEMPIELVDELFQFCGMLANEPQHSEMCLHIALSQNNHAKISKVFTDKGIPSLESLKFADNIESLESEDDEECDSKEKRSKKSKPGADGSRKKKEHTADAPKVFKVVVCIILSPIILSAIGISTLFKKKNKPFDDKDNGASNSKFIMGGKNSPKASAKKVEPKPKKPKVSKDETRSTSFKWGNLFLSSKDIAFTGEFAVHQILKETLGANYNPLLQWTSPNRTHAKIAPFLPANPERYSNFKFIDINGSFTQFLSNDRFPAAENWIENPPTYHIDVKSTKGNLHTEFDISPQQFNRARDFSIMMQQMKGDVDSTPDDIYILVRVYDVGGVGEGKGDEAKMVFVVDPWESYHADRLVIKPQGKLVGSIV